jgi:hypothetical protein
MIKIVRNSKINNEVHKYQEIEEEEEIKEEFDDN